VSDSEHFAQRVEDGRRRLEEIGQRWHNRLTRKNPRLAQRYLDFDIVFAILVRLESAEEFVAVFERQRMDIGFDPESEGPLPLDEFGVAAERLDEQLVLVRDVEIVDGPQRLMVPSLVRLERKQEVDKRLRGSLYLSGSQGVPLLFGGDARFAPDRERGVGGHLAPATADGSAGEMVEGRAKVVNRVPRDEGDGCRDRRVDLDNALVALRVLRVVLLDECIWVGGIEGDELPFEIIDVLLGPFDLDVRLRLSRARTRLDGHHRSLGYPQGDVPSDRPCSRFYVFGANDDGAKLESVRVVSDDPDHTLVGRDGIVRLDRSVAASDDYLVVVYLGKDYTTDDPLTTGTERVTLAETPPSDSGLFITPVGSIMHVRLTLCAPRELVPRVTLVEHDLATPWTPAEPDVEQERTSDAPVVFAIDNPKVGYRYEIAWAY
jgi:hypothetical protein